MAATGDINEIEEFNANCILMANLQQASTSGTQTDKASVYDSDRLAEGSYPSSSATCLFSNTATSNSVGFIVFGKLPAINGFGIPLQVAVYSGIANSSL
ncbi:hypothetical protein Tco_0079811 [Tanacetum coccineum]